MATIANRLFRLRHDRGWTIEQASVACRVSRSHYYALERGTTTPRLDTAMTIAAVYGVTLDYLCGLSDSRNPPLTRPWLSAYGRLSPFQQEVIADFTLFLDSKNYKRENYHEHTPL